LVLQVRMRKPRIQNGALGKYDMDGLAAPGAARRLGGRRIK